MTANSPAMTITAPQATFLKPATLLDVQVLVSSSSGGMVHILARSRSFAQAAPRPVRVPISSRGRAAAMPDFRLWPIATDDALTAKRRFRGIADMDRFSAPNDL